MVRKKHAFKKKALSVIASSAIVASSFAGVSTYSPLEASAALKTANHQLEKTKLSRLTNLSEVTSLANSEEAVQELIIVGDGETNVSKQLTKLGVEVKINHKNYVYLADVPTNKIYDVIDMDGVTTVGKNEKVQLDKVDPEELNVEGQNEVKKDAVVTPEQIETHPETGVTEFHKKYDGSGVRVGIIDSGPDAGHESFTEKPEDFEQTRKYGESKIVGVGDYTISSRRLAYPIEDRYKDFLDDSTNELSEGDVLFDGGHEEGDSITVSKESGDVSFNTTNIDAADDTLYYGETAFEADADLNGDGVPYKDEDDKLVGERDNFSVLLADDQVYIDTDADNDFTDETAYSNDEAGTFDYDLSNDTVGANFRVNDLTRDFLGAGIKLVNLYTDLNGHGSHVAGITAADGPLVENEFGAVAGQGVAPGAELVGLRVFQEEGGAFNWSIQTAMVDAALPESEGGFDVDIANLSLGSSPDLNDGTGSYGELMTLLTNKFDISFVTSAGNAGPGIDTVGSPGDVDSNITVGASIDADNWAKEYNSYPYGKNEDGTPKEGNGLWYFSSVGPNEIGDQKPEIVAPGSAFAAHPVHMGPYVVMQGTSMSSPYVAGAVALLKSAALKDRVPFNTELAKEALVQTADPIEGYNRAQQGGGLINVPAAYEYLKANNDAVVKKVEVTVFHGEKVSGGPGLYVRNKDIPETVEVLVENPTDEAKNLSVKASEDWFTPSVSSLSLAAGESQLITVSYDKDKLVTGVNAGTLVFDDASTSYVEARSAQTIVTGYEFTTENDHRFSVTDEVQSSQTKGYTFDVESGVSEIRFSLSALVENDEYQGRVRIIAFGPDGIEEYNEFAGYAGYGAEGLKSHDVVVPSPKAGVWEVHVYGTSDPVEGKVMNKYQLEAIAQDVVAAPGKIDLGKTDSKEVTKSVSFTNYLKDTKDVKVVGVPFSGTESTTKEVEVPGNNQYYKQEIKVKNNVSLSVQTSNPTVATDDVDLYLKNEAGDIVTYSAGASSDEKFSVSSLPDGTYTIEIEGFATANPTTTVDLAVSEFSVLSPGEEGKGSVDADATKTLHVGESMTTDVSITTPESSEDSIAAVYLLDAKTDEVLSLVPITVDGDIINVVSGADREETAIAASHEMYPEGGADTVVVTTGYDFPDALSAGPLASQFDAPIIPVRANGELSDKALNEIERLGAKNVYIVGGETAVKASVVNRLNTISISSDNIERLAGANRYETNLAIVKELQDLGMTGNGVFLATGQTYADALSAASVAGEKGMPIVLTNGKDISEETSKVLEDEDVYVLGGETAVPEEVLAEADKVALSVTRLGGANRYGTLVEILKEFDVSSDKLFAASGMDYPDALAAAPLVTQKNGLLLLVGPDKLPNEVEAYLTKYNYTHNVNSVTVLGGDTAVSQDVKDALQKKLK
ncbi:cell wall-binding repeat-containing protein [Virgibacillus flavescens]|uniref:cell wall-binding repeat-containing protein n=1 Tax=Virgibacillus flavescens TaxID=1611422 RepID=UPI003D3414E1